MTQDVRQAAGWIPADQARLEAWLEGHVARVEQAAPRKLRASVAAFRDLIDAEPVVGMLVQRMLEQQPENREYHAHHIRDVEHLLALLDGVMDLAPEYGEENVTLPMGAVLDWSMGTPAGFAAFRDARINAALQAILREWCEFLDSPGSLYVLHDGPNGWKSEQAVADVGMDQFVHDPAEERWGFRSWNDFFTRRFKDGERPTAAPDDHSVVVAACESTPFALRDSVRFRDRFWLKGHTTVVGPGEHVDKGDELGYFRFGGSTHCLIFEPGVVRSVALQAVPRPGDPDAPTVRVRSQIATVRTS